MPYADDLKRCNKIFSHNQVASSTTTISLSPAIYVCMHEWHLVLKSYRSNMPGLLENIYWVAILGTTGRLFEALIQNPNFKNILTFNFTSSVRRVLYHSRGPFYATNTGEPIPPHQTVAFFIHCYEHCRKELTKSTTVEFPALDYAIDVTDRQLPLFHRIMNVGTIWAQEKIEDSEIKAKALARLTSNEAMFATYLICVHKNLTHFIGAATAENIHKAIIVLGSYIGAEIAWLSCDVSSLLQGRATTDPHQQQSAPLSHQEYEQVCKYRDRYLELGKEYRHGNICLSILTEIYGFRLKDLSQKLSATPQPIIPSFQRQQSIAVTTTSPTSSTAVATKQKYQPPV